MQAEDIVALIALAWLIVSMLFLMRSVRRGQALADTFAIRHREKYKAAGRPRPGYLQSARRNRFAQFVARREYRDLGDPQLVARFEAYRRTENRVVLTVIATMVIVGALVLAVQYGA